MKNLMVANWREGARVSRGELRALLDAQVENSLALGWTPRDLMIVANFPYEYLGVQSQGVEELNTHCLRGSKMFALDQLFKSGQIGTDDLIWAHDLDAWQNFWFAPPEFADIGIAEYSQPKFNGGSVFVRYAAQDVVAQIVSRIVEKREDREEPTINQVLRSLPHEERVTVLNSTYNLGCSGFRERFTRGSKPILVSHFHPTNKMAWDTHINNRNGMGETTAPRLVELLIRRFHRGIAPQKLPPSKKKKQCLDGTR